MNADEWIANDEIVEIVCVVLGENATYTVDHVDGRNETWSWWARTTDDAWLRTAVLFDDNGPNGLPVC